MYVRLPIILRLTRILFAKNILGGNIMKNHECEAGLELKYHEWGHAVTHCFENDDGELWVDNGEYSNQVYYCPFCGYKAKIQK